MTDCHTHLVADGTVGGLERAATLTAGEVDEVVRASLRAHLACGVTTVRDLGHLGYRTLEARELPGLPRVVAAGPPITTPDGHCHCLGGAVQGSGDSALRAAVAERAERGVDVVKVMASGGFATPGTDHLGAQFGTAALSVLVDQAHRVGLRLVAHAHSLVAMEYALAADVDGIEHFSGLSETHGAYIDDEVLHDAARRGTFVELTEALAAATSTAADACGLEKETGRLAAGYAADLLVVSGDLTADLGTLDTPVAVMLRLVGVRTRPDLGNRGYLSTAVCGWPQRAICGRCGLRQT